MFPRQFVRISSSLFLSCLISLFLAAQTPEVTRPITNRDVIELTMAGLSSDILIARIKASTCNFDTSVEGLKELKQSVLGAIVRIVVLKPWADESSLWWDACLNKGESL